MNFTNASILYVDDDDLTRTTVARRLRREGYCVLEADSADKALRLFKSVREIDLLLIEPALGMRHSLEMHRTLRQLSPTLPVAVCTVAIEDVSAPVLQAERIQANCCCSKPCCFSELVICIQRALLNSPISSESQPA